MADVRRLKDEAARAVEKGKHRRAAELYAELAQAERDEPLWPHRAGEAFRRAGLRDEALRELVVAAEGYGRQGFLLKAIAVAKMILEVDPTRGETQVMLAALYARRDGSASSASSAPSALSSVPLSAPPANPRSTLPYLGAARPTSSLDATTRRTSSMDAIRPASSPDTPHPPSTVGMALSVDPRASAGDLAESGAAGGIEVDTPSTAPTFADAIGAPVQLADLPTGVFTPPARLGPPPMPPRAHLTRPPIAPPPPREPQRHPTLDLGDGLDAGVVEATEAAEAPLHIEVLAPPSASSAPPPEALLAAAAPPAPAQLPIDPIDWSGTFARDDIAGTPAASPPPPPPSAPLRPPLAAPSFLDGRPRSEHSLAEIELATTIPGAHRSGDFTIEAFAIPLAEAFAQSFAAANASPALPETPLLSSLDEPRLRRLIEDSRIVRLVDGDVAVRQGEPGESLYVVVRGEVRVTVDGSVAPVALLGEGAFFGELALVTGARRMATVTAAAPEVELLEITRALIWGLVDEAPNVLQVLLRFFRDRLIERLIATSPIFSAFSMEDARHLADRFQFLELPEDSVMIHEGVRAEGLFLILCGACEVAASERGTIAFIGPGDLAGEMSLLHRGPAMATVRTCERVWALAMPRASFHEMIVTHPPVLEFVHLVAEARWEAMPTRVALV